MPDRPFRKLLVAALAVAIPLVVSAQNPLQPGAGGGYGGSTASESGYAPVMPMVRSAAVLDPDRKLQPGDLLTFKIEQDPKDAPVPVAVRPTGDLLVEPLDHAVHVAGLTVSGAAAELKRQLEKDYYYTASVRLVLETVTQANIGRVYISGAVNRTGEFPLPADRQMKLSDVIAACQGFAKFANQRAVKLTRVVNGEPKVYTVDVKEVTMKSRVDLDMDVRDGDRIVVTENFVQFK